MQKYHNQARLDSKQKSRNKAITLLRMLGKKVGINSNYDKIIEESEKFYNKTLRYDLVKGRSIGLAVIASLYHGCRLYNYPISIEGIVEKSANKCEVKQVRKYHTKLITNFENNRPIHIDLEQIARRTMEKIIGLRSDTYRKVLGRLKTVEENGIHLGVPRVFVSAVIYMVAKQNDNKITQKTISNVTGISQRSISLKCKHIREESKLL